MIRKIAIENYFSILDEVALDFTIARNATDPEDRFASPIEGSPDRYPKVVALFGPNASGKTTFLRAIAFLRAFLTDSADWPRDHRIPIVHFLSRAGGSRPTKFSVEFDARLDPGTGRQRFVYALEISRRLNAVASESLIYYPYGRGRKLFERRGNIIDAGADFGLSRKDPIRKKLRGNASVISMLAKFEHPVAVKLYNAIGAVRSNVAVSGTPVFSAEAMIEFYDEAPDCLAELNNGVRRFDFGIEKVSLAKDGRDTRAMFRHVGLETPISLEFESQGTRNFFGLHPVLWWGLKTGTVVVIDEFDNDIHPLILPEIVSMFQSPEENPNNAQLIMSCHNPILLEHLAKEEICFTEKDAKGQTRIYSLADVKGVRRDANIYAKYLSGEFGGVPRVA